MYGMVNEGIRTFIEENFGQEAWQSICHEAQIGTTEFDRLGAYDDQVTYALVGAVSNHTRLPTETVLKVFGEYWVEYALQSGFKNLLKLAGDSFVERVRNLDEMHDRILMAMPNLKPPSFELDMINETTYRLRYYSDRKGLAPMVVGLLHGLAAQTQEQIAVEHLGPSDSDADCETFQIVLVH